MVSIVVVCFNEKENISACLSSLVQQKYPKEKYEILCVDNGSDDGTLSLIKEFCLKNDRVSLIVNPVRGIAGSRNIGLQNSRFDFVAFIDADCVAPADWLENMVAGYFKYEVNTRLAAVGGANIPPQAAHPFYDVLRIFLNSYLGSHGSVQGKNYSADKIVTHLPTVNVMYHKHSLLSIGGFDIKFGNIGEDQDVSYRLADNGYRLYYLANTEIFHKLRAGYQAWFKNMFVYGKGRSWLMCKHPKHLKPVLLLPMILVGLHLAAIIFWPAMIFILYYPLIFIVSVLECRKAGQPELFVKLSVLYIGTHLLYGLGQWYGLFKPRCLALFCSEREV
ncbi:glycosyltransferase [candidate division KSB1 bacterium]|nr:glycosyltransferase [candidate division KSB1 bacterium]